MKIFFLTSLLFVISYTIDAQININSDHIPALKELEQEYIDSDSDPKGIDIIKNYNNSYNFLTKAFEDKGLTFDIGNFDKKVIKSYPDLKLHFKNFRKALKVKINYFSKIESFKETINLVYPYHKS